MDRFEGSCWLDWWVNPITRFSTPITAEITATGGGWHARGRLTDATEADGFRLICELDPFLSLRFDDNSAIDVLVSDLTNDNAFTLTEAP